MSGKWTVDAVKGGFCVQMQVTGPSNPKAWALARREADKSGADLSMGSCSSKGYDTVARTFPPKTFNRSGYNIAWGGKLWSK